MKRNTMSFKAIINNIAKENKVSAQSILQTYMLERLLERISVSKYIHMLLNTQGKNIDKETLKNAIISTAEHRDTMDYIKEWKEVVEILENDSTMKKQWERYQRNNFYEEGIEYKDLIESLNKIGEIFK